MWHPKFKGECAEVAFLAKAMSLGFTVSKPYGDTSPFDFIVTLGARTWRVNVKSTWERQRNGEYRIRVGGCSTFGPRRYRKGEVDFVVGYVMREDAWYVIPMGAIPTRFTIDLKPHLGRRGGRFEKYREAWGLLRTKEKVERKKEKVRAAVRQRQRSAISSR